MSVEVTPGKAGHIGECWTLTYSAGGIRFRSTATVLEWEENRKTVWQLGSGMMEGKIIELCEPADGTATKFTFRSEFRMKGLAKILAPLMVPMTKRNMRRAFGNMKRICEAGTRPS